MALRAAATTSLQASLIEGWADGWIDGWVKDGWILGITDQITFTCE